MSLTVLKSLEQGLWSSEHLLALNGAHEVIGMEEVVSSRVSAMRLTPIVVHADETSVEDHRKCVWLSCGDDVHHPDWLVDKRRSESVQQHRLVSFFSSQIEIGCEMVGD